MRTDPRDQALKILVADDEPAARDLVSMILTQEGWPTPTLAEDGQAALDQLEKGHWDILVTDLDMPRMNGENLVRRAVEISRDLTIVVTTGNGSVRKAVELMQHGVVDFIMKPYDVDEFLASMERARHRAVNIHEIRGMREVVEALLAALESKDRYLNGHSSRVSRYAVELGRFAGLDRNALRFLEYSALLHDVGKIGVHEEILNKPGRLNNSEFNQIQKHPGMSRDILGPVKFLEPCLESVYHHHENFDGTGYPDGVVGEQIPIESRIISIVDAFDAMTSDRSYRGALAAEEALVRIEKGAGHQFDPELVRLFIENFEQVIDLEEVHQ